MKSKLMIGAILLAVLVTFLTGAAISELSGQDLPEEFSWYGESGALRSPVYDEQKGGEWWMPEKAPEGQENTQWGNRGYVFVGKKKAVVAEKPCPAPAPAPKEKVVYVEKPVEKIVYKDRIVEKPVEKIVYRDKIVEKVVYRDKIVPMTVNLKDVYFEWDSAKLTNLALATLKDNADVLKANPSVNVLLLGSASPEGQSNYNQKLSERRVAAVKDYLVSKEGISASRLNIQAKGEIPAEQPSWPFVRKVAFAIAK